MFDMPIGVTIEHYWQWWNVSVEMEKGYKVQEIEEMLKKTLILDIKECMSDTALERRLVKRHCIEMWMDFYLLDTERQILYPRRKRPNTYMDTWTVPLLFFVMVIVCERFKWRRTLPFFVKLIDASEQSPFRLQGKFGGKLENLIHELVITSADSRRLWRMSYLWISKGIKCDKIPEHVRYIIEAYKKADHEEKLKKDYAYNVVHAVESEEDDEAYKDRIDYAVTEFMLKCFDLEPVFVGFHTSADIRYSDVHDIRVRKHTDEIPEDLVPNVQNVLSANEADKEELKVDRCKKEGDVIDDEETYKDVLDKSILAIKECMDPEPILDRFQVNADIRYTDVRDIREQTTTTQKNDKIIEKVRQKHSCYKQFKKYLVESSQSLLLEYIEQTENGKDTTDVLKHLNEETRRRDLKERREQKLKEESTRNSFEEQLVISVRKGKDFDGPEEIEERMTIYTSSDHNKMSNAVKCILEGATETHSEQIVKAVKGVASIINVKIKTSIDEENTVIMTMACISCEELRELLKILGGDEFKSKICNLENVLSKEYNINCQIQDKVSHDKIQEVQKHLIDQGVINEAYADKVFCGTHDQQEVKLFCPQHDHFFCYECEEKHRMCKGLRQITKDVNTKEYRIRSDEPKEELCTTLKLCILPTCEVLLIDNVNKRLKKLDLTYHVVGQYQFEDDDTPLDVCAVSGSKAVVTFANKVYVVNVESTLKVERCFKTENPCFRFDTSGNIIYYTDNKGIYKCDGNGKHLDELYSFQAKIFCNSLVVSNDSSKVIVAARSKCLMIISTNKSEQSTLILEGLKDCTDLCMLNSQMLLVCENNSLCLVDVKQGQLVRSVAVKSTELLKYRSIVFDDTNNTVIAGNLAKDFITVFEVDTEDTDCKAP